MTSSTSSNTPSSDQLREKVKKLQVFEALDGVYESEFSNSLWDNNEGNEYVEEVLTLIQEVNKQSHSVDIEQVQVNNQKAPDKQELSERTGADISIADEELREYIKLRYSTDPIEAFNLFIKRNCPDLYAHFIDTDDNEAEYVRRIISSTNRTLIDKIIAGLPEKKRMSEKLITDSQAMRYGFNQAIDLITTQLKQLQEGE